MPSWVFPQSLLAEFYQQSLRGITSLHMNPYLQLPMLNRPALRQLLVGFGFLPNTTVAWQPARTQNWHFPPLARVTRPSLPSARPVPQVNDARVMCVFLYHWTGQGKAKTACLALASESLPGP